LNQNTQFNDQYMQGLVKILDEGYEEPNDRTGVGRKKTSHVSIEHDMSVNFPALTLRSIPPRIAFEELAMMLQGETQTKVLEEKGIKIWKGNTTKDFQKSVGLDHKLSEGDMGKLYGYQLRAFDDRFDQLEMVFNSLRDSPGSSRHIVSYYNPNQTDEGVLYPCHIFFQFIPMGDKLDLMFYMRSNDYILGLPTNMAFYGFLLLIMAKATGYYPGKLTYVGGDVHIYLNHINAAYELLDRWKWMYDIPHPKVDVDVDINNIHDFSKLDYETQVVYHTPYEHHGKLKNPTPMAK